MGVYKNIPNRGPDPGWLGCLYNNIKGTIGVLGGISVFLVIGCAALALDPSLAYYNHARLQASVDAAALASAHDIGRASVIAVDSLKDNNIAANNLNAVILGTYCADATVSPAARFREGAIEGCPVPTGALPNAVKIVASTNSPVYFGGALGRTTPISVAAAGVATRIDAAGLKAGSGTVGLTQGGVNLVLSALIGQPVGLDVLSYQGIVSAKIDATKFVNALMISANVGTYQSLATAKVSVLQVIEAEISVLSSSGNTSTLAIAGLRVLEASLPYGASLTVGKLIDPLMWSLQQSGNETAALTANLSVYDILVGSLTVSDLSHAVSATPQLVLPGIGSLVINTTLIEPMQSAVFEFGPQGVSVHTAQIRLQITLTLLPVAFNGQSGVINLPIYVEVASGYAKISSINCGLNPRSDTTVSVFADTGIAKAWIGVMNTSAFSDFSTDLDASSVSPVAILNLGLIQVYAESFAQVGSGSANLVFDVNQMNSGTIQSVSSKNLVGTLLSTMLGQSILSIKIAGLDITLPGLAPLVQGILSLVPIDSILDLVLQNLGVRVGYLDVSVTSARCGVSALIQ